MSLWSRVRSLKRHRMSLCSSQAPGGPVHLSCVMYMSPLSFPPFLLCSQKKKRMDPDTLKGTGEKNFARFSLCPALGTRAGEHPESRAGQDNDKLYGVSQHWRAQCSFKCSFLHMAGGFLSAAKEGNELPQWNPLKKVMGRIPTKREIPSSMMRFPLLQARLHFSLNENNYQIYRRIYPISF